MVFLCSNFPFNFQKGSEYRIYFIESDRNRREDETGKQCRIVLFLDMDTLGEIAVDAGIKTGDPMYS